MYSKYIVSKYNVSKYSFTYNILELRNRINFFEIHGTRTAASLTLRYSPIKSVVSDILMIQLGQLIKM